MSLEHPVRTQRLFYFITFFLIIKPLFNQESPIEIENLFCKGGLAKTDSSTKHIGTEYQSIYILRHLPLNLLFWILMHLVRLIQ